jgi:hypothetical protein
MILLVPVLAMAAAPIETSTDPVQRYSNCVIWKAGDLEPSGEAANLIANAVAPECDGLLQAAATTLTDEFLSKPDMVEYQKRYSVNRSSLVAANAETLRKSATEKAELLVIELRAKRAKAANAKN